MQDTAVNQSEIQLQAECWQWAWNTYPDTRRLLFHVPNGGSRSKIEGMQLKASGVVPGIPDLLFLWHGRLYSFELKTLTGTVSDDQALVHITWETHCVSTHIVRTLETFQRIFTQIINNGK
jgi:hypothetical protein